MIFNMVGGGAGGATLVVSSPANVSVTVSKDDKSYTKNSGSLGSATFKGLATGIWTVVISNNGQTATRTIEITADYAITIAFFSASINITYPANSTCVVKNSSGQTVASNSNTGTSTKTWTATVNATGTYTVTATATDGSGKSKSQSVSITAEGQSECVKLVYWSGTLYDAGDEYVAVTGGWIAEGMSYNTTYKDKVVPTVTRNADNIVMKVARTNACGTLRTADKVYIADYTKLTADIFASDAEFCSICFWTEIGTYRTDNLAQEIFITNKTRKTIEAAITLPGGEYYVGLVALDNRTITMYSMKLS